MITNNFQKNTILSLLISIGCIWGFTEFFASAVLKDILLYDATGSVLIGTSFFFLAAGFTIYRKSLGIIIPLTICILLKLVATILIGKSISSPTFINPLISMLTEAAVFILMYKLLINQENTSIYKMLAAGAIAALIVALIFPLNTYLNLPICLKKGTNIPISIYYIHYSMIAGAISFTLGLNLNSLINKAKEKIARKRFIWELNTISIALIILSLWMNSIK